MKTNHSKTDIRGAWQLPIPTEVEGNGFQDIQQLLRGSV